MWSDTYRRGGGGGGGSEEAFLARWFVSVVAVKDNKEAYECCSSSMFQCCSTSTETVRTIVGTGGGRGGGWTGRPPRLSHSSWALRTVSFFRCCFTSTNTLRTIRDGEPRTSTSTFTQLRLRVVRVCCCVQNSDRADGAGLAAWSKLPRHVGLQQYGTSRKISSSSSSARPAIISVNYYYCGNQHAVIY